MIGVLVVFVGAYVASAVLGYWLMGVLAAHAQRKALQEWEEEERKYREGKS